MVQAKYVYGIIRNNHRHNFVSIEEKNLKKVHLIPYRDIACVVRDYPKNSFDMKERDVVARFLISHQKTVETIRTKYSIILLKFGTILEDSHEVVKLLEEGYSEFNEGLIKFQGKIELDVTASWNDLNTVIRKIAGQEKSIRDFSEEVSRKRHEDTFQDRINIGSMIKQVLDRRRNELQKEMLEFLTNRVKLDDQKKHDLMDDRMILNCAFLLNKDREKEFDLALGELNDCFNEEIKFKCIGPLPLNSFATYEVKKSDILEIGKAMKLLGLESEFNVFNVKSTYRELVRKKHPDKFPNDLDAQIQFQEIHSACELLLKHSGIERKSFDRGKSKYAYAVNLLDAGLYQ